jgi:hypothetical protein
LECLDDNELEAVFHAVKEHPRVLGKLASTCGRFNELVGCHSDTSMLQLFQYAHLPYGSWSVCTLCCERFNVT